MPDGGSASSDISIAGIRRNYCAGAPGGQESSLTES
jgi:hypothetical protein